LLSISVLRVLIVFFMFFLINLIYSVNIENKFSAFISGNTTRIHLLLVCCNLWLDNINVDKLLCSIV
jgi:hypothetical protein